MLTAIRSGRGNLRTSGWGGPAPVSISRQTAAPKQKALNSTRTVPARMMVHSGTTPRNVAFAPTPLASATSDVRTQAA